MTNEEAFDAWFEKYCGWPPVGQLNKLRSAWNAALDYAALRGITHSIAQPAPAVPVQQEALTDERILSIAERCGAVWAKHAFSGRLLNGGARDALTDFARAIEMELKGDAVGHSGDANKMVTPKPRAVERYSDMSVLVRFDSCHEAGVYESIARRLLAGERE